MSKSLLMYFIGKITEFCLNMLRFQDVVNLCSNEELLGPFSTLFFYYLRNYYYSHSINIDHLWGGDFLLLSSTWSFKVYTGSVIKGVYWHMVFDLILLHFIKLCHWGSKSLIWSRAFVKYMCAIKCLLAQQIFG